MCPIYGCHMIKKCVLRSSVKEADVLWLAGYPGWNVLNITFKHLYRNVPKSEIQVCRWSVCSLILIKLLLFSELCHWENLWPVLWPRKRCSLCSCKCRGGTDKTETGKSTCFCRAIRHLWRQSCADDIKKLWHNSGDDIVWNNWETWRTRWDGTTAGCHGTSPCNWWRSKSEWATAQWVVYDRLVSVIHSSCWRWWRETEVVEYHKSMLLG